MPLLSERVLRRGRGCVGLTVALIVAAGCKPDDRGSEGSAVQVPPERGAPPWSDETWQGVGDLPAGVLVLARGQGRIHDLVVDQDHVYWSSEQAIRRAPLAGGDVETIAAVPATRLAVAGDWIYFTDGPGGTVSRVPLGGGAPEVLARAAGAAGLDVADGRVYFTAAGENPGRGTPIGSVQVVDAGGGETTFLADQLPLPSAIRVHEGYAYFTSSAPRVEGASPYAGGIHRVPVGGGPIETLSEEGGGRNLVVDASGVYFLLADPARLVRSPHAAGELAILSEDVRLSGRLTGGPDGFYVAGYRGRVVHIAPGGAVTQLNDGLQDPDAVAAGPDLVYVTIPELGALLAVPRDGSASWRTGPITGPCPEPLGTAGELASTPRADWNLELLAMTLDVGSPVAAQATYDRLVADVAAARALEPRLEGIDHRPYHDGRTLGLQLAYRAGQVLEMGQYTAWDCLNDFYGLDEVTSWGPGGVTLRLKGRYNMPLLASLYAQLPGVLRADPDRYGIDGPTICANRDGGTYYYAFDLAGGDCPSGCTTNRVWYLISDAPGDVRLVDYWEYLEDDGGDYAPPEWYRRLCFGPL